MSLQIYISTIKGQYPQSGEEPLNLISYLILATFAKFMRQAQSGYSPKAQRE